MDQIPPYRVSWDYKGTSYLATLMLTDKVQLIDLKVVYNTTQPVKSKGLGDTVKNVIHRVTRGKVKQCDKCKKRQEALNKMLPYKGDSDGR